MHILPALKLIWTVGSYLYVDLILSCLPGTCCFVFLQATAGLLLEVCGNFLFLERAPLKYNYAVYKETQYKGVLNVLQSEQFKKNLTYSERKICH